MKTKNSFLWTLTFEIKWLLVQHPNTKMNCTDSSALGQ